MIFMHLFSTGHLYDVGRRDGRLLPHARRTEDVLGQQPDRRDVLAVLLGHQRPRVRRQDDDGHPEDVARQWREPPHRVLRQAPET